MSTTNDNHRAIRLELSRIWDVALVDRPPSAPLPLLLLPPPLVVARPSYSLRNASDLGFTTVHSISGWTVKSVIANGLRKQLPTIQPGQARSPGFPLPRFPHTHFQGPGLLCHVPRRPRRSSRRPKVGLVVARSAVLCQTAPSDG